MKTDTCYYCGVTFSANHAHDRACCGAPPCRKKQLTMQTEKKNRAARERWRAKQAAQGRARGKVNGRRGSIRQAAYANPWAGSVDTAPGARNNGNARAVDSVLDTMSREEGRTCDVRTGEIITCEVCGRVRQPHVSGWGSDLWGYDLCPRCVVESVTSANYQGVKS